MVRFYKVLNNIIIYSESSIEPMSGIEVTGFFHIKKDNNPQYFSCRYNGELTTILAVDSVVEEIMDKELTAEIGTYLQ
jgi:hypothetical protein